MSEQPHLSDEMTFVVDDEGWMTARCLCEWEQGPLPGPEEVVDALMTHAFEQGQMTSEGDPGGS